MNTATKALLAISATAALAAPILAQQHIEESCNINPAFFHPRADYLLRVAVANMAAYDAFYRRSIDDRDAFFDQRGHPARDGFRLPSTSASDAQTPIKQPVHELARVTLQVVSGKATSLLWNEYMARYHYLGYAAMSGSQIRYNVFAGEQLVACISFCACAWKLKDRERFIGWSEEQRQKNLQLVINNARFLVLPWIESKGLASKILSLAARQLPKDWKQRYGFEPVLLETFVESPRHKGICYKAANWIHVGQTTGRGKKCPVHEAVIPVKDIWLYPLRKDFARVLRA